SRCLLHRKQAYPLASSTGVPMLANSDPPSLQICAYRLVTHRTQRRRTDSPRGEEYRTPLSAFSSPHGFFEEASKYIQATFPASLPEGLDLMRLIITHRSLVPCEGNAQASLVKRMWRIREPSHSAPQASLTKK